MARQNGVETRLPFDVTVVLIQIDALDASAANDGDLAIACNGATLGATPNVVTAGTRRTLIYDVTPDEQGRKQGYLEVSVGSREAWRPAGVIGLGGDAQGWGERLAGSVPPELVSPLALSADGSVVIRFEVLPDRGRASALKPARPAGRARENKRTKAATASPAGAATEKVTHG
jgi:hypothetical protein